MINTNQNNIALNANSIAQRAAGSLEGEVASLGSGDSALGSLLELSLNAVAISKGGANPVANESIVEASEVFLKDFDPDVLNDIATLMGGLNSARNLVQTTLDGVATNPSAVVKALELIGKSQRPATSKIGEAHNPGRPSANLGNTKKASSRLTIELKSSREDGTLQLKATETLVHCMDYMNLMPKNMGWPSEGTTKTAPRSSERVLSDASALNEKVAEYGNDFVAKEGSAMSRLPKPAFFEDILAAFMIDEVLNQQDEVAKKIAELQSIKQKQDAAESQKATNGTSSDAAAGPEEEKTWLGKAASIVEVTGKIAGTVATLTPVLAFAANLIPPPAGQTISAGLVAAAPFLAAYAAIAPTLTDSLNEMDAKKRAEQAATPNATSNNAEAPASAASAGGAKASSKGVAAKGVEEDAGPQSAESLERSRSLLFEEMKQAVNRMQEMQTALSNILKAMHDTAMGSIRNIK